MTMRKPDTSNSARVPRTRALAWILAVLLPLSAAPGAAEDSTEVRELKTTVEALQKTVQALQERLAALEREKAASGAVPPATAVPAAPVPPSVPVPAGEAAPAAVEGKASLVPDYQNLSDQQAAAPRPDNVPMDPALKGFIAIPGTQSMIRPGGSARLDTLGDFGNGGNPNWFVPSSIPVEGESAYDESGSTALHTKGTRLTFEYRRPLPKGENLKIFYENDFFDDSSSSGMKYRLRHFYGQAANFIVGQTFSAFQNIDSWPDTVDYQGPNAMANRRQPQFRYIARPAEGQSVHVSLEQPSSEIDDSTAGFPAGSSTRTLYPDLALAYRFERKKGHFQASGLARTLAFDADDGEGQSVFGWGLNLSGAQNIAKADKLTWQMAYGEGMARYFNDTNGLDLDAALDGEGDLDAIPLFAGMIGYSHRWSDQWRSTGSFGYVEADPLPTQGASALRITQYASLNLVWQPVRSARVGIEYLHGTRETQGGDEGSSDRIHIVFKYDLVK